MAKRHAPKRPSRPRKVGLRESTVRTIESLSPPAVVPAEIEKQEPVQEDRPGLHQRERVTFFSFTVGAVLLGIALGFYLGSEASRNTPPAGALQPTGSIAKIDRDRARKILVMIQEELVENARVLKQQREVQHGGRVDPSVSFQFVKNDLWRAIVNGNDVQAIHDLDLLSTIATAYRYIDEIRMLERKVLEASSLPGRPGSAAKEGERLLFASLTKISPIAEKAVIEAAVQIDHKLNAKE